MGVAVKVLIPFFIFIFIATVILNREKTTCFWCVSDTGAVVEHTENGSPTEVVYLFVLVIYYKGGK